MSDESYNGSLYGNQDYVNNNSFMLKRIDPSDLMSKIKKDIGGKVVVLLQDDDGKYYETMEQIARPLANEEGVLRISNIVEEMINTHTFQGNLKEEQYYLFLARVREEIAAELVMKCYEWGIKDSDIEPIIDKIMRITELVLTRPLNNEERKSYGKEFQSKEVIQTNPQSEGMFKNFAGGFGGK